MCVRERGRCISLVIARVGERERERDGDGETWKEGNGRNERGGEERS